MSAFRKSGSFTLSPKKHQGFNIPGSSVTTSTRRQSFNTPSNSLVLLDGSGNNDEAEKRERQLIRLQQLQSRGVQSPTRTPIDRRKSTNTFAGLTNQQITEHYAKCIQLSAENKINIKNAFNLQLIDYMTELLKRKDSEMHNFQVASCTLDASTKIYGYRVDSVHTDTLKMAGGLGRTKEKPDAEGGDFEGGDDETKGRKKAKTRKCVTVETNLKNLNVAHFDLEFDVDPMFKKTATQFDEGSAGGGQFLNTLHLLDDSCQLVLDSETVLLDNLRESHSLQMLIATIPPIPDVSKLISPTFAPFEFTTWTLSDDDVFSDLSKTRKESDSEHAFDMNAVPEPLEEDIFDQQDADGFNELTCNGGVDEDETVITLGGGACGQGPHPPPPQLEILHLKDHLANSPLEYSYFDTRVMSAWAGPGHWKLKPLVKVSGMDGNRESRTKDKQRKDLILEYKEDLEVEKHFAVLRRATKLSQNTVKKWSSHNTTLPVDLHYDPAKLSKLNSRAGIIIRRQALEKPAEVDDNINDYNYDNKNDKENYCPDVDAGSNFGDNSAPGYDDTDIFSQTVFPSQPSQDQNGDKIRDFLGDNLVEAPNKVSLINIRYARTAKKIDMKKLKTSMWTLLSDSDTNKENERNNLFKEKMDEGYGKEFSRLYRDLHPRLPPKMAENLSVPLAFIALLHLANEHCLKLCSIEELGDFVISQG